MLLKEKGASIIFSTHRMESVEELCEYIALLHQSEKILDGKLSEIKKAYKNNIYRVGLEAENGDILLKELSEKFDISSTKYDPNEKQLDFTVQLPNHDSAHMLAYLIQQGQHQSFCGDHSFGQ